MGLASRPRAMAAVPAAPTSVSSAAARTLTDRRGAERRLAMTGRPASHPVDIRTHFCEACTGSAMAARLGSDRACLHGPALQLSIAMVRFRYRRGSPAGLWPQKATRELGARAVIIVIVGRNEKEGMRAAEIVSCSSSSKWAPSGKHEAERHCISWLP